VKIVMGDGSPPPRAARTRFVRIERRFAVAMVVVAAALSAPGGSAQAQTMEQLWARVDGYVEQFKSVFSKVMTEETYRQSLKNSSGVVRMTRELRSDLLLYWPPTLDTWVEFRDVYQVDDKAVRDRQDRLEKLFLQPFETALAQAKQITEASARYNIGDIQRDFNTPTFTLHILKPSIRARFEIKKVKTDFIRGVRAWVIQFDERARPTLIRDHDKDRDIPSVVTFWIDPGSGSILKSQLVVYDVPVDRQARITVAFQPDSKLGIWAPTEMTELYDHPRGRSSGGRTFLDQQGATHFVHVVTGRATYSNFRQLSVETEVEVQEATTQ